MSKRRRDEWFPLYVADYLRDTMHLNTTQHGAYMLLLMGAWTRAGELPKDEAQLAAIAGMPMKAWRQTWPVLAPFFTDTGECLIQQRLYAEVERARVISDARRETGKQGGRPKQNDTERKPIGSGDGNLLGNQTGKQNETHARVALPTTSSVPNGTGADAPLDPDKKAWAEVVTLLASAGVADKQARSFFGRLLKESGLQARDLLASIAQAQANSTGDPQSYLRKAADAVGRRKGTAQLPLPDAPDWPARVQVWRDTGRWFESMWGPAPGDPQCRCPAELLEGVS